MKFKEPIVLFKTIVGSHMWGQHRSDSDTDLFKCYVFDTKSFLLGNTHDGGHRSVNKEKDEETDSFEIGHVIRQLLKGNINFLWGVMSPKVQMTARDVEPSLWDLRQIVLDNLSKATMYSIKGFVIHNLKHWFGLILEKIVSIEGKTFYIVKKKNLPKLIPEDKKYWKIVNTCARTLDFGIKLLRDRVLDFDNPKGAVSPRDVILMLGELETVYKTSKLQEKPNPAPFEEFLIKVRHRKWMIDVIFDGLKENDMSIDEFCSLLKGIKDVREGRFVEL